MEETTTVVLEPTAQELIEEAPKPAKRKKKAPAKSKTPPAVPAHTTKALESCTKPELIASVETLLKDIKELECQMDDLHDQYGKHIHELNQTVKESAQNALQARATMHIVLDQLNAIRGTIHLGM